MSSSREADSDAGEPQYPLSSVGNALRILLLLRDRRTVTLTEAARELRIANSTAHRLFAMLVHHGFVSRSPIDKRYEPGPALVSLGLAAAHGVDIRRSARPHLELLAKEVGETVNLIFLEGKSVRFVDCIECDQALRIASRVGLRRPAHLTSVGKLLLSYLEPPELDLLLPEDGELRALTDASVTSRATLEAELETIRANGFATNMGESDPEVHAVGVAILGGGGEPVAGIGVSAPASRLDAARIPDIVQRARFAAAQIEVSLRGPGGMDRGSSES